MLLSTEYSQKLFDVSDSTSVPHPQIKRAKVPKIHANTATESISAKWLQNIRELLDESNNTQVTDKRRNR
jgi:hypothetical protein